MITMNTEEFIAFLVAIAIIASSAMASVCYVATGKRSVDKEAIKAGMVQSVDHGKTIWTRPKLEQ